MPVAMYRVLSRSRETCSLLIYKMTWIIYRVSLGPSSLPDCKSRNSVHGTRRTPPTVIHYDRGPGDERQPWNPAYILSLPPVRFLGVRSIP